MEASADHRLVAGRYVLGGPLGRGGMGTVWRADDVLLHRPVAVKEVELPTGPPGTDGRTLRARALREARAAARLNHPGAVTLHDVVEADGRLFLVMELVEAPNLRELVEGSGPLAPAAAARVGLELLEALDAAHRAGIVHHDVKPALGQFCLVALGVENTGREGRTFGGGSQFLFDAAGNRHDPDLSAHLNPGQHLAGTLVYDVPNRIELARIELHDGPFSRGASVQLG